MKYINVGTISVNTRKLLMIVTYILVNGCGVQINNNSYLQIADSDSNGSASNTTAVDQTDDDNTSAGFGGATHNGTSYTGTALTLTSTTNISELNKSWAPGWSDLLAYYKMDEGSWDGTANEVQDSSGNNHHGVRVGNATTASGKLSNSGSFDGTGDYFTIPDIDISSGGTVMAWVKFNNVTSDHALVAIDSGGNEFQLWMDENSTTDYMKIAVWDGSTFQVATGSTLIKANSWYHVAFTTNGSRARLFVNGVQDASDLNYSFSNSTQDWHIGASIFDSTKDFDGLIDELAVFSSELTSEDLTVIYQRQLATFTAEMKSRIIDSQSNNAAWTNIDWVTPLPFGKELPGASGSESSADYSSLVGSNGLTSDNDLMDGLVGLWHLNGIGTPTDDDLVVDKSSYGNNGQIKDGDASNNIKYTDSLFGQGLDLDGTNDYVEVPYDSSLDISNYTLSAWIKVPSNASGFLTIIEKAVGVAADDRTFWLDVWSGSGVLNLRHSSTSSWVDCSVSGGNDLRDNNWHHVSATFDGSTCSIYVDGLLVNSDSTSSNPPEGIGGNLYIGQDIGGASRYLKGTIDEVAVWNRPLSSSEILQLYRRGANRIKYQIRTCASSDCSDQDALSGDGWKGPGGNYLTYFSELYSNSSATSSCATPLECYNNEIASNGDVNTGSASVYFNNYGTDGLQEADNNRYFQYRVIMESDDQNTACNSGTETCLPELNSVSIGPGHAY